jgi:DNA-binding transcriptional regulator YiaG
MATTNKAPANKVTKKSPKKKATTPTQARVRQVRLDLPGPDAVAVREAFAMQQQEFADYFGLTLSFVRNIEQGRTEWSSAARAFYTILQHEPEAAKRAIRKARIVEG